MDEASRWKMLELLQDKRYESFRRALQQWFRIFDPPERLVSDQESALGSEEMVVWLEGKNCKLEFLPTAAGGSSGAHTAAGVIESNNRVVREALHTCETAMIEEQIPFDAEYLKDEAMWCLNAVPQHAGLCASQAMIAHTPKDPLGVHKLTTTLQTVQSCKSQTS